MSFHEIKNNDLAKAEIIMSNYRHINYGNPLMPVDHNGVFVDNRLDLGERSSRWNTLYTSNIEIKNQVRYLKHNAGDMFVIDKNKNQVAIPIGNKDEYLVSNGLGENPQWKKHRKWPIRKVLDSGWHDQKIKIVEAKLTEKVDRFKDNFLVHFSGRCTKRETGHPDLNTEGRTFPAINGVNSYGIMGRYEGNDRQLMIHFSGIRIQIQPDNETVHMGKSAPGAVILMPRTASGETSNDNRHTYYIDQKYSEKMEDATHMYVDAVTEIDDFTYRIKLFKIFNEEL